MKLSSCFLCSEIRFIIKISIISHTHTIICMYICVCVCVSFVNAVKSYCADVLNNAHNQLHNVGTVRSKLRVSKQVVIRYHIWLQHVHFDSSRTILYMYILVSHVLYTFMKYVYLFTHACFYTCKWPFSIANKLCLLTMYPMILWWMDGCDRFATVFGIWTKLLKISPKRPLMNLMDGQIKTVGISKMEYTGILGYAR